MALVNVAAIEDELGLTTAEATRVARYLPEAAAYLVALKGSAWYNGWYSQARVARPRPVDPEEVSIPINAVAGRVYAERAEALLALYYALPQLNLKLADGGGVLSVTYTSGASGTVETRFASADALDGLRRELLTHVKLLIDGDVRVVYSLTETTLIDSVSGFAAGSTLGVI